MCCRFIGDWPIESFQFSAHFREVRKCTLTRGGQTFPIVCSRWKKVGEGNNLVLVHFKENNITRYYVGEVTNMISCEHYRSHRLVVLMDLKEVETCQIECDEEDGGVFSTTLSNLWQEKDEGKVDTLMCPAWEIPHKTMLCRGEKKDYYCVYK